MGGAFRKKLVEQNAMSTDGCPRKTWQTGIIKVSENLRIRWLCDLVVENVSFEA